MIANVKVIVDRSLFRAVISAGTTSIIESHMIQTAVRMRFLMRLPKTGRTSPRPGGITHRASAPGEAPAVDTGRLFNSIFFEMVSPTKGRVTVNAPYAAYLEDGTVHMAVRPFVRPAVDFVVQSNGAVLAGVI